MIADHRLPRRRGDDRQWRRDGPGSERGLEYDTVSGKYAEFVERKFFPRLKRLRRDADQDPDGRLALGASSGGSASLSMAWFHPEFIIAC